MHKYRSVMVLDNFFISCSLSSRAGQLTAHRNAKDKAYPTSIHLHSIKHIGDILPKTRHRHAPNTR